LLGLACGDALGTTLEFKSRGSFTPITTITGGGPFNLKLGEWTDDTSMALCLATSLIEMDGFDPQDQMERYCRWQETGYLSSTGHCFDIGNTVAAALQRFRQDGNPYAGDSNPFSAGNGSIMRLAPVVLFYFPDEAKVIHYAIESSRTTHAAQECLDACRLFAEILSRALYGEQKNQVLFASTNNSFYASKIAALANGQYHQKSEQHIRGSGSVV
jgi:ADP-ribosyl-[dinitrogen reductase] hydrolase